jgi:hypothetical protein
MQGQSPIKEYPRDQYDDRRKVNIKLAGRNGYVARTGQDISGWWQTVTGTGVALLSQMSMPTPFVAGRLVDKDYLIRLAV